MYLFGEGRGWDYEMTIVATMIYNIYTHAKHHSYKSLENYYYYCYYQFLFLIYHT